MFVIQVPHYTSQPNLQKAQILKFHVVLNFMESSNSAIATALQSCFFENPHLKVWIFKIANSTEFLCCRDMELCRTLPNQTKLPNYFKLNPITLNFAKNLLPHVQIRI